MFIVLRLLQKTLLVYAVKYLLYNVISCLKLNINILKGAVESRAGAGLVGHADLREKAEDGTVYNSS